MSCDRYNIYENIKPGKLSGVIRLIYCYNIKYSPVIQYTGRTSPWALSAVRLVNKTIVGFYCTALAVHDSYLQYLPSRLGHSRAMLQWYYDQIFTPWSFLGVSRRIPWKNKNADYRLQISALVPEIFKFKKCVKYANEKTDDVIHSTQYYIKHISRAILANLQRRPLKLGRLIVLQETYLRL